MRRLGLILPAGLAAALLWPAAVGAEPAPLGLTATASGASGVVNLSWTAPADGNPILGYNVYYASPGGPSSVFPGPGAGTAQLAFVSAPATAFQASLGAGVDGEAVAYWVTTVDNPGAGPSEGSPVGPVVATSFLGLQSAGMAFTPGSSPEGVNFTFTNPSGFGTYAQSISLAASSGGFTQWFGSVSLSAGLTGTSAVLVLPYCKTVSVTAQVLSGTASAPGAGGPVSAPQPVTVPCQPWSLTATATGVSGKVQLVWGRIAPATSYSVYLTAPAGTNTLFPAGLSPVATGLGTTAFLSSRPDLDGVPTAFWVTSLDSDGESAPKGPALATSYVSVSASSAPLIQAGLLPQGQVSLTISASPSYGTDAVAITVSANTASGPEFVASLPVTAIGGQMPLAWTGNLPVCGGLSLSATAVDSQGNSGPAGVSAPFTVPCGPAAVNASGTGTQGVVNLTWTAVSDGTLASYTIYAATSAPFSLANALSTTGIPAGTTSYAFNWPAAQDGQAGSYWVSATDATGESVPTGPVLAQPFVADSAPSISAAAMVGGFGKVNLTVLPVAPPAGSLAMASISVSASVAGEPSVWVASIPNPITTGAGVPASMTATGAFLPYCGLVGISAQAVDVSGNAGPAGPVFALSVTCGPTTLAAQSLTWGAESFSWAADPSAVSYVLKADQASSGSLSTPADPDSAFSTLITSTAATAFTWSDSGGGLGHNAVYRVYSVDAQGLTSTSYSWQAGAVPAPANTAYAYSLAMPAFSAFKFDGTTVTASWALPASALYPLTYTVWAANAGLGNPLATALVKTAVALTGTSASVSFTWTGGAWTAASFYLSVSGSGSDNGIVQGRASSPAMPTSSAQLQVPVLAQPANLNAAFVDGGVRLDWGAVPNALSYTLFRTDLGSVPLAVVTAPTHFYLDTAPISGAALATGVSYSVQAQTTLYEAPVGYGIPEGLAAPPLAGSEDFSPATPSILAAHTALSAPSISAMQIEDYGSVSLTVDTVGLAGNLDHILVTAVCNGVGPVAVASIPNTVSWTPATLSGVGGPLPFCGHVSFTAYAVDPFGISGPASAVTGFAYQSVTCGPKMLSVTAQGGSPSSGEVVGLNWSPVWDATGYSVYAGPNPGAAQPLTILVGTTNAQTTSLNWTNTIAGTGQTLYYQVYATTLSGATTAAYAPIAGLAYSLGAPAFSSLTVSAGPGAGNNTLLASWVQPTGAAPFIYSLYGATSASAESFTPLGPIGSGTSVSVPSQYSSFYVTARDANGAVSPLSPPASCVAGLALPSAVTGLASSVVDGAIKLTWTAVSGADGYLLFRSDLGGVALTSTAGSSFLDFSALGLLGAPNLTYTVQAFASLTAPVQTVAYGPTSAALVQTFPSLPAIAPFTLTATATGALAVSSTSSGAVALVWTTLSAGASSSPVSGYDIFYSTTGMNPASAVPLTRVAATATSFTTSVANGVLDGVLAWYWVAGDAGSGPGSFSPAAEAESWAPPLAPQVGVSALPYGQGITVTVAVSSTAASVVPPALVTLTASWGGAVHETLTLPFARGLAFTTLTAQAAEAQAGAVLVPCGVTISVAAQVEDVLGNLGPFSVTTPASSALYPCAPLAGVLSVGASNLGLSWTAGSGQASAGYLVLSGSASGLPDPLPDTVAAVAALATSLTATPSPANASAWYRVYAVGPGGLLSAGSSDMAFLPPPGQVQATPLQGAVGLSWSPPAASSVPGLSAWEIYYSHDPTVLAGPLTQTAANLAAAGPTVLTATVLASVSSTVLSGLLDQTLYAFAVAALGPGSSPQLSGSPSAVTATTGLAQAQVTSVTSVQQAGYPAELEALTWPAQVQVTWIGTNFTPATDTAWVIYRATDAVSSPQTFGSITPVATVASTVFSATLPAGSPGPNWYFVDLSDSAGSLTGGGNTSNARTVASAFFSPSLGQPNLGSASQSNGRVVLQWPGDSPGLQYADTFTVYRATQAASPLQFSVLGRVSASLSWTAQEYSYVDAAAVSNAQNIYLVVPSLVTNAGLLLGSASNVLTITPPVLPDQPGIWWTAGAGNTGPASGHYLTCAAASANTVALEWTPSGAGSFPVSYYQVFRSNAGSGLAALTVSANALTSTAYSWTPANVSATAFGLTTTVLSYTDPSPPQPLSNLVYAVQAVDSAGNAGNPVTGTVTAPLPWPAPILVDTLGMGYNSTSYDGRPGITLTWSPSGGVGTLPFQYWSVTRTAQPGSQDRQVTQFGGFAPSETGTAFASLGVASGSTTPTETGITDGGSLTHGLPSGSVTYWVQAVDSSGNLGLPLVLTVATTSPAAATTTPKVVPGPLTLTPEVLSAASAGGGEATLGVGLTWQPNYPSDAVTGYAVYRNNMLLALTSGLSYTDPAGYAFDTGQSVAYAVYGMNAFGQGSAPLSSSTALSPPAPGWLSITADLSSAVQVGTPAVGLAWPNVLQALTLSAQAPVSYTWSYAVYRSDGVVYPGLTNTAWGPNGLAVCRWNDPAPNLTASGVTYTVKSTVNNWPVGVGSPATSAGSVSVAAPPPVILQAVSSCPAALAGVAGLPTGGAVVLSWTANSAAQEYWIYRASYPLDAGPPAGAWLAAVTGTGFVDTGIPGAGTTSAQTQPWYAVAAASQFCVGPAADVGPLGAVSVAGLFAQAGSQPLTWTPQSNPQVTLSWAAPASDGVASYSLSRMAVAGFESLTGSAGNVTTTVSLGSVTGTSYIDTFPASIPGGWYKSSSGRPFGAVTFQYTVAANSSLGAPSGASAAITVTAFLQPSSPTALVGTGLPGGVDASWAPSPSYQDVTGYAVSWSIPSAAASGLSPVAGGAADWQMTGLLPGQAVDLSVQAFNAAGASPWSAAIAVTAAATGAPPTPLYLSETTGFLSSVSTQSSVLLSFSGAGAGAVAVDIYRVPPPNGAGGAYRGVPIASASGGASSPDYLTSVPVSYIALTDTAVLPNVSYAYAISAVNALGAPAGESAALDGSPTAITAFNTWAAPAVSGTAGNARVDLWWSAPPAASAGSRPLLGYKIYRYTSSTYVSATGQAAPDAGFPVFMPVTSTAWTDLGVSNGLGTGYFYVMTSVDMKYDESATASFPQYPFGALGFQPSAPLLPPTNITAQPGNKSVSLWWVTTQSDAAAGGVYNVYRRNEGSGGVATAYGPPLSNLFHVGPTVASYPVSSGISVTLLVQSLVDGPTPTPVPNLTPVCYAITAVNGSGEGPKSKEVCTTPFNAIDPSAFGGGAFLNLAITNTTAVALSWAAIPLSGNAGVGGYSMLPSASPFIAGYNVYRSDDGGNTYNRLGRLPTQQQPPNATESTPVLYSDTTTAQAHSYYYRVLPYDNGGNEGLPYDLKFVDIPSGKNALYIFRNSFNPATGGTVPVQCGLQGSGTYWIKVYTLNGEYVNTIVPPSQAMGGPNNPWLSPQAVWDGRNAQGQTVASGVYLIHLEGPGYRADGRVAVIK